MKKTLTQSRLLALLLTMVMLLSMVLPGSAVSATETTETTETVTELPTQTVPVDTTTESGAEPAFYQCNFTDETQLSDFDLYQSGTSKFVISDGVLVADGTDGEQKAIFNKDVSRIESVSVNILPGESGVIYGGLYFGASDPTDTQDGIQSHIILIKSDYSGWSDAANRIDIVHGAFDGSWKHISTTISETGNDNNLFSGGTKEALNLKLDFSEDVLLLTLSLVSNSAKYVQVMYELEPEDMQGQIGLRSIGSDTKYDKFVVNEKHKPATLTQGLIVDGTGTSSYGKTVGGMTEKPVTIEAWFKMESFSNGSRRQAIVSNHTESGLAKNSQTWGLYTNEYGTLYYTERSELGEFNSTLGIKVWKNEWIHLVLVRGDGILKVYLNGELAKSVESTKIGAVTSKESSLTFGYCTVGGSTGINAMKGEIGDIRLWSTERTEVQIQDAMYQEMEGTEEGLIQHWNFDSQEKGIVSNTVEGGLDCELLGHTQIGNQTIHRWDFSQESQLEDFTYYYAPDYNSDTYNNVHTITNGMLFFSGSINDSSTDVKAVLNHKLENITYIGADVTQGGTINSNSGILLGIKSINTNAAGDYEGIRVRLGRLRTSSAKRPYSEIDFCKADGSYSALTSLVANKTFFPDANTKLPYHIQVELDGNTANAYMYRLDDPTIDNSQSYTFADGELDGQIGLWSGRTSVYYDNFTVVCEEPVVEEEVTETVSYQNEGHNFFTANNKCWEMNEDVPATPLTLEAWVKIPKGIADGTTGFIVGNQYRAPYISMKMAEAGKLRLTWGVENADLTTAAIDFDVDTDLRNGKWTHVAYTCDVENDTVTAYINGKAAATWTDAGLQEISLPDHVTPENHFIVGSIKGSLGAASSPLPGWIADVRLWSEPLTADQIRDSMMTQYTQPRDGLMLNAAMNEQTDGVYADLSGNGYCLQQAVTGMVMEEQTHEPGSYSIVVIPDQQILSHYYVDQLNAMYQWIADNREKENIQIVLNVGDIADNCGNATQWANSRAAWELLPDDLPFIAVPGNHDYDTNSGWNKGYGVRSQLTMMNEYFPMSLFEDYATEFGALSREQGEEDNVANTYQAFEVNGNKYLVLALEYVPRDDAIAWANEVVASHPNHQVIQLTHNYMGSYGNLNVPNLWNNFTSLHDNIIMAFSGHVWHTGVVHRADKGVNGNDVHQMLMDAQGVDAGGGKYAMLGILRFNADGTQCEVSYYSTDRGMYEARSTFNLTLPKQEHTYSALVGTESFETVTEAIAAADGEIVKILRNTDEAIAVSADLTIDLAGCTLSNVTVDEGYSLKLIDTVSGGSAAVTGSVEGMTEVNSEIYWVTDENGVYTARYCVGALQQQVSLGDDLAMNFVFRADKSTSVNVIFDGVTTACDLSTLNVDSYGKYTVSVDLAAAQMTEEIKLQFVSGDAVMLEKTYSVRRYAEAILTGDFDDSIKNMVKAMLNYGAKAQLYFDVNEDDLANAGYELSEVTLPTEYEERSVTGSVEGLQYYGASLIFTNKIAVRFYFTGSVEGVSFGDYEAVQKGDMYYVEVADVNPQDYSNLIALTATKGEETLTVCYSPLNYIIRMSGRDTTAPELKALLNALYGYHTAAMQYVLTGTTDLK